MLEVCEDNMSRVAPTVIEVSSDTFKMETADYNEDKSLVLIVDDEPETAQEIAESLQILTQQLEASNTKLKQENQLKDKFLAMISDELRTPLHQIVDLTGILNDEVMNPLHREYLENIKDAGWRLTNIVSAVFDMISIENDTFKLNTREVSMSELIMQAVEVHRAQALKSRVLITANDLTDIKCYVDERRLSQALGYIISNAIESSPVNGYMQITTQAVDKGVRISIHDDGPGISPQDQKKALQPLVQVDGSETREQGGVRLGLSLAKAIVKLHGGQLIIESAVALGTTIIIEIPSSSH